jgi:hypothetical protein
VLAQFFLWGHLKKKNSIISFKIWFFFGINLHCLSCFGFYWAILLGQSESRGLVVLPDFDCFFKSFLFVIFFLSISSFYS